MRLVSNIGYKLCLFVIAGCVLVGSAENAFNTARTIPVSGAVPDGQTAVVIEHKASSMPDGARCVYHADVADGQYSANIRLFPGNNLVTVASGTEIRELYKPVWVPPPKLVIVFYCSDQDYHLTVNNWQGSVGNFGYYEVYSRYAAPAGLYKIRVYHFVERIDENGEPVEPVTAATFVNVYLNGKLVASRSNGDGRVDWEVGTLVVHSGDVPGAFSVKGSMLDLAGQGELKGYYTPYPPNLYYSVGYVSGPGGGTDPVYLPIGNAAQFSAEGSTTGYGIWPNQNTYLIGNFTSSDESVGTIDATGVFIAKAPGHTQVSWGGYAGAPIDVYVINADADVDSDYDGGIDDADDPLEESSGGLVVIGAGNLTPVNLSFAPEGLESETLTLSAVSGGGKIRVWPENNTNGTPLTLPKTWAAGSDTIPPTVYVQGVQPSDSARDVTFLLSYTGRVSCEDAVKLTVVKCETAMDGNRDGEINFDDPDDKQYLFWVNDDCDKIENGEEDDAETGPSDCSDNAITCKRDLEDFTRLHIKVDPLLANMQGVTYWLRFDNWAESTPPSVNVFQAVCATEDYLKSEDKADEQIAEPNLTPNRVWLMEVPINEVYISRSGASTFLIEGRLPGTADLTFVVRRDGNEICKSSVRLTLKPISYFYDIYSVTASGENWNVEVGSVAVHSQTAAYQPETNEKFLFVHGWNMAGWEKRRWAETAFKRLWWQGYQGSFALFDWPTLYDYHGAADYLQDPHHFDNSEFRSWLSSSALASLLEALNSSGELRVLAHSMGNVVAGEALSKYAGGPLIHTYIASQAAISAHYYDNAISADYPCGHQEFDLDFPDTPDVIGHYHPGLVPNSWDYKLPYLGGVAGHVNNMKNWFNGVDYALDLWERNNVVKPDGNAGYFFFYTGSESYYSEGVDRFFGGPNIGEEPLSLTVERERHMIFAYAAESRSRALGQTANGRFNNWDLESPTSQGGMGYDDQHYAHSREFRSNIIAERIYWLRVAVACGFENQEQER